MKNYLRICVGADGFVLGGATTLHNSSSISSLLSFNYPKNFGESISSITIKFNRNISTADDTILGPGKEIDIWWSNTLTDVTPTPDALPSNTFRLFRGYIIDKKLSGNVITITASDVFIKTMWTIGTSSTDINKNTTTPIKTLLTNLCAAAGLTASNNIAVSSPENVITFYSEKQNIFERISYLLNLIGWYGYYDPTTASTIIFQPKTAGAAQVFTVANIIRIPEWSNDSRDLFNEVTLTGGSNQKTISETHTIDSGTMYTLNAGSVKPEALVVTAQTGTLPKTSWTPDEYYVASNAIIFTKGTEPTTNGNSLYIEFTYQTTSTSTTVANTDTPTSQSLYLLRQKAIQKRDTLNSTDLTSLATNLVDNDFWGKPLQEVTITVNDGILLPILGSKADVTDPMSGRSITYAVHNTIVYSIEFQWPVIGVRTFISSRPLKNPMQQTTVQDSVEKIQLELQKIDPTSLMRKDGSTPLISATGYWNLGGAQLLNHRLENSTVAPAKLGTGGVFLDTSGGAGAGVYKINLGTATVPAWTGYLPLTGGTITGKIDWKDGANASALRLQAVGANSFIDGLTGNLYINAVNTANSVNLRIADVSKLNIADTVITAAIHIHMSDQPIDLRTDNVHTIGYASGTNSLDIQSWDELRFLLTQNGGVVPMSIMTDGIRIWEALFFRKNQASDTVYIADDATANMEFHVGTGKVFEFIVG